MMHATTPPYTKPEAAYDSRRLYDETSAIAAAQDAKLDPGNDALPSILADFRAVVKRLDDYAERRRVKRDDGIPAESAYLLKNGSRIATPAEVDGLREVLTAEELRGFGIGDIEPATLCGIPDSFIDSYGNLITWRDVANHATTVATSQHPANAETIRYHDERLSGPEDHL